MNSKKGKYYVLMGDVIASSDYEAVELGKNLKELVKTVNKQLEGQTLSPYTITLGDEFQGITKNLETGIKTLFCFEEMILKNQYPFKLHYVLHYGKIDTEINTESSYGMLGEGLTVARKKLSSKKRDRKRFNFSLDNKETSDQLTKLFEVLDGIISRWKVDDYPLILDMIKNNNDSEVAEKYNKDRSQIWRRRNTLMIDEYNNLKAFIFIYI